MVAAASSPIGQTLVEAGSVADDRVEEAVGSTTAVEPTEVPAVRARRAKRANRSARARKDKLRSASDTAVVIQMRPPAIPDVVSDPEPAPEPKKAATAAWLVAPG